MAIVVALRENTGGSYQDVTIDITTGWRIIKLYSKLILWLINMKGGTENSDLQSIYNCGAHYFVHWRI